MSLCRRFGRRGWGCGTRRESIPGGSRAPSMAHDGPAAPPTPPFDTVSVGWGSASATATATATASATASATATATANSTARSSTLLREAAFFFLQLGCIGIDRRPCFIIWRWHELRTMGCLIAGGSLRRNRVASRWIADRASTCGDGSSCEKCGGSTSLQSNVTATAFHPWRPSHSPPTS